MTIENIIEEMSEQTCPEFAHHTKYVISEFLNSKIQTATVDEALFYIMRFNDEFYILCNIEISRYREAIYSPSIIS
jgi:hypothetical protein